MIDKKISHIHTRKSHDGVEYSHNHADIHDHGYGHSDGHGHSHQNTKTVLNRLSRASGHLEAVKRMVEDEKDCTEVLIQLSAVIAALKSTGKVILADHIANCIVDAVESGDNKAIDNLNVAIDRFIK
jgi:CsoR family transcriptional regulator, copper-sensing transcriptional repressor